MIVQYEDLSKYRGKVVMVDGCFDPIHFGHVEYFKRASEFGLPVLCNVQADEYIRKVKGRPSLLPEDQRIKVIDAFEHISWAHLCRTSTHDILERLRPAKYVKGMDWQTRGLPEIQKQICASRGIGIECLDTNLESSTNIVENFEASLLRDYNARSLRKFESLLFSQKAVGADFYDDHYFRGDWRAGDNDYSIEKRRRIEAKNPENIRDVFKPTTVLDVGCGTGALMYFLHELGIECHGIDFSERARVIAPPEVRARIVTGPVTEYHNFKMDFDLVICREVLEHLTILQVKRAVSTIAAYTSKYLYLTTRYYPSPKGLLDVTDDIGTDPTHLTLLNKDFLMILFMLEGLKRRPDLEEKMDWKQFGRVLVFERGR
jgi:cytidyltransferase-like protein